ncbi:hypothetical protein CPB84DRAFT_1673464 [Gymnopilus junonius]|uniref:Uncharacterized protein n=1 Tax=Gymnopilus junonius TaxID=109634 RepID=A0A9P5NY81_GYMJU|nr:hypothetical protein CPB84DRAFT_1673464 [Gymnopilus junonius]
MRSSKFTQLPRLSLFAQFLSQHDDPLRRGFITRLDRSPVARKRSALSNPFLPSSSLYTRLAFLKALLLNVSVLLFTSALAAITILRDLTSPLPTPVKLAFCITQDVLIATAIVVLVRSTTVPFFFGECQLRLLYGFRPSEIIIRKPPSVPLLLNSDVPEDQRMERFWRMATRAVNPELLYSNASAMLSSDYWTLEYRAVFDAIRRIQRGQFTDDALEFAIFKQDDGIWNVCELWRMHEIMTDQQEVTMFKVRCYSYSSSYLSLTCGPGIPHSVWER